MAALHDKNGMIYVDHDFANDYFNAVGYNDKFSVDHQLLDEIGKLIVDSKKDIVDLFRANGFNVSIKDNDIKLGQLIASEIGKKNKHIAEGIAKLIIDKNNVTDKKLQSTAYGKKLMADGGETGVEVDKSGNPVKSKTDWGGIAKSAASITTDLISAFSKKPASPSQPSPTNALLERIKTNQMLQGSKSSFPTWAKISIGVGGGILLLVLIIVLVKHSGGSSSPAPASTTT